MQQVAQGRDDNRDEYQQLAQSLRDDHLEIEQILAHGTLTVQQRQQLITKYTDIIVRLEAQIRALVGEPQPVEPQPATQEQESVPGDPVLEYVQALESTDPWQLNKIMSTYEHNEAIMAAVRALHKIFDPAISFTEQLRAYRATGHIGA